jgi:hypothetical protein
MQLHRGGRVQLRGQDEAGIYYTCIYTNIILVCRCIYILVYIMGGASHVCARDVFAHLQNCWYLNSTRKAICNVRVLWLWCGYGCCALRLVYTVAAVRCGCDGATFGTTSRGCFWCDQA